MPSLFDFAHDAGPDAKMHVSVGDLPPYVDPAQPPIKKSPWRQINELPFVRSVTIAMPDEMYELLWDKLEHELKKVRYAKVMMKLQDVLDGDFFTEYIKKGNILMLSEGGAGVDNVFTLRDGILRLDLDKESFECAGLQGQPVRGGGRKHVKARYVVEFELRQPSMLHGKKGFERLVWAAKNVLNHSVTWLFADVGGTTQAPASSTPLEEHHPTYIEVEPSMRMLDQVSVPAILHSIHGKPLHDDSDNYHELIEWLDLLALESPSLPDGNTQDAYITRYCPPETASLPQCLRSLQVQGLISTQWVKELLIGIIRFSRPTRSHQWLAFSATAHRTHAVGHIDGYTILLASSRDNGDAMDTANDLTRTNRDSYQSMPSALGLKHFTTFQMVDTLT